MKRVLEGEGKASREARRAAFDNKSDVPLVDKIARTAWKITDEDVAATKLSDDEVFELAVCAAVGQATRQLDAALAALEAVEE